MSIARWTLDIIFFLMNILSYSSFSILYIYIFNIRIRNQIYAYVTFS